MVIVSEDLIVIFVLKGLRSISSSQSGLVEVSEVDRMGLSSMERPLGWQYWVKHIIACQQESMTKARTANTINGGIYLLGDNISLYGVTNCGAIVKYTKDLGDEQAKWRVHNLVGLETGAHPLTSQIDQVAT
jgi:hypothetical protein